MIGVDGLQHLRDALARLDLASTQQAALAAGADELADGVRSLLSHEPGADHTTPWLRTGALRESIASASTATEAAVGSTDPVAIHQEQGTSTVPPRPFLAPAAAASAEHIAKAIGGAIAEAIAKELR